MKIIPAIDIMNHKVVQLVGGVPGTEKITLPDPVEVAQSWIDKGAKYLHMVDLDAAFGKEGNVDTIRRIAETTDVPIQVGGGVRDEATIRKLIDAGVDRVIVGTKGITDHDWFIRMADTFPDRLILALDTKNGNITVKGWQEASPISLDSMLDSMKDVPIYGVLNTNIDVEGQGKGIDEAWVEKFTGMCTHRVIASGGVTTELDARTLAKYGVDSAVVGVSIYTGLCEPWNWSTPWEA